ncbi:MAG: BON domain-containing protein [Gemmatimonadetes bacterium]|nr:BON domain-containing protein [Gemmatimonadota bacterium]
MYDRRQEGVSAWLLAAGAAAGASAISLVVLRRLRRGRPTPPSRIDSLEEAAVEALRRDPLTSGCEIDVAATASGMIELTGIVPTHEIAQRAARLLHALPGVRTVVNRLDTGALEQQLAMNRSRRARGEPATQEKQWYGVRVGTGRRRQSPETDPDRNDDTLKRITRDLEVSASDIADGLNGDHDIDR